MFYTLPLLECQEKFSYFFIWKKENLNYNIFDPASIQRMQDRVRQGSYTMKPTDAELSAYIDTLRQNGLDGSVDWSGLTSELDSFKATTSEELEVTLLGLQFRKQ